MFDHTGDNHAFFDHIYYYTFKHAKPSPRNYICGNGISS